MNQIEYRIVKNAAPDKILDLYRQAGWWTEQDTPDSLDFISRIISHTYCFAIALDGERIIGMGRIISDGVSDAYIQDVTVQQDYRRQGIGQQIIRTLVKHLKGNDITWIGLISEPGYQSFYENLGFSRMEGYTPFLLKE
ncbi:MAG: GNAT family N-acetyltransferase [Candidatus Cloacimonetes bacterium]|nr:GNAT family N-acetyltransferase [Candidatus Cloacimonadota bacterium]